MGLVIPVAVAEQDIMAEAFPLSMVSCGGSVAVSRGGTAKTRGTHTHTDSIMPFTSQLMCGSLHSGR